MVCPFEFCLDLTLWADAVICDYNYVFDPTVSLKRFFAGDGKNPYVFLIDEAHNLPERAREMYSGTLWKDEFLTVKKILGKQMPKLAKRLEACNKELLRMKRECDSFKEYTEFGGLSLVLTRLMTECEEYLKDEKRPKEERDAVLNLYFEVRHFLAMYDFSDTDYRYYASYGEDGAFYVRVQCMQPARALGEQLKKGKNYLEEYQNTCRELLSAVIDYNNSGIIYHYKGESTKHDEKCIRITELCWDLITSGRYSPNLFTIIMKIFKDRTTEGDC
jgi:hypothetical protein